jgi:hypothetical protein
MFPHCAYFSKICRKKQAFQKHVKKTQLNVLDHEIKEAAGILLNLSFASSESRESSISMEDHQNAQNIRQLHLQKNQNIQLSSLNARQMHEQHSSLNLGNNIPPISSQKSGQQCPFSYHLLQNNQFIMLKMASPGLNIVNAKAKGKKLCVGTWIRPINVDGTLV